MKIILRYMVFIIAGVAILSCKGSGDNDLTKYVDTRIGTQAWKKGSTLSGPEEPSGFVYPGVGHPYAMIQLSPQTARTDRCYFSSQPYIQGFRASHYPNGAAMSEYCSFTVMPSTGALGERAHERESDYSHDNEIAKPYYYSVNLDRYRIKAELTGASTSGCIRFTFPKSDSAHITFDNARSEYGNYFHVIPQSQEVEGYVTTAGRVGNQGYAGKDFACFFVAKFNKAFETCDILPEPIFGEDSALFPGGFSGEFFDNPNFNGKPVAIITTKNLDFQWEGSPAKGISEDHFSARFTSVFKARKTGKHVFYLTTDDYSRLSVGGIKAIDTKKTHRPFTDMYSFCLNEGDTASVKVEYVENTRLATVRLHCVEPESRSEPELMKMAQNGSAAAAASVSFKTEEGEVVDIKIGTSFISIDQARKNLEREIGKKTFDEVRDEAKDIWNSTVSRIRIEAKESDKQIFYTAMQRVSLLPRNITEDGMHYSAFNDRVMPGIMYTDYSLWDTFRALHPLLTILDPERVNEMITGLLNCYDEGGWIPKWPSPGYSNIMTGTHGDAVIADAYVKGIRGYDLDKALKAMIKDATTPGTGIYKARVGILDYIRLGYVPTDKEKESVIRTMEFAYDDFCIAQVAKGMGREDLHNTLMRRSMNYINVLDPETKLIRGRNSDGSWRSPEDTDVSTWSKGTERDRETYYRNITFFVPHDVQGLINFFGGSKELEATLDHFFEGDFYYVGDEFSMHSPYLYNYAGAAWKTQKTVRRLVRDKFSNGMDGLPGNDDCGQLSAWYIFSAMGFYPTCPGLPIYQIGSPSFNKTEIFLTNGRTFKVIAKDNSPENVYIQSATLDGKPYTKSWISHEDIMRGGTLVFKMGSTPNKEWGSGKDDIAPSISKPLVAEGAVSSMTPNN
ncbi:MAG: GH92 family glycosyl hydrolase [Bacteroidales bacterium]|nr:GH92 family glycosyl hydrolase [Bacteroidales bacterium]